MATFNKPIATNQGIALLKAEVAGTDSITFTKTVFSSDDYSQTADSDIANLTAIKSLDLTTNAQTFQDVNGNTKVRAIGYNNSVNQAFYIKTYALYAKNKSGNEILFAVASSQTADFVPAFNNAQLTQISYTFTFAIDQTSNITLSDQHEITVTQADIASINSAVNSNASSLTATQSSFANSMNSAFSANNSNNSSYVSSATNSLNSYVSSNVSNMQSQVGSNATNIANNSSAISANATSIANNTSSISSLSSSAGSAISTNATNISALQSSVATNSNVISSNASLTNTAINQINANVENVQGQVNGLNNQAVIKQPNGIANNSANFLDTIKTLPDGYYYALALYNNPGLPSDFGGWGFILKIQFGGDFMVNATSTGGAVWSNTYNGYRAQYTGWQKMGG